MKKTDLTDKSTSYSESVTLNNMKPNPDNANADVIRVPVPTLKDLSAKYSQSETQIEKTRHEAQAMMTPITKTFSIKENGQNRLYRITREGVGPVKNAKGLLWMYQFKMDDIWQKYSVLVAGDIDIDTLQPRFKNPDKMLIRIDSGCETGQVFHDLTCDCRDQLHKAIDAIISAGEGMIINIPRQDGRGKGLPFKLATLYLQDRINLDTVEAASILSEDGVIDVRTYAGSIGILQFFGVPTGTGILLATNNSHKEKVFASNGYRVADAISMAIPPTEHTKRHLQAKGEKLAHRILVL